MKIAAMVSKSLPQVTKVMHGTPSGIDNSVATHGGVVAYRAGAMAPLQVNIWPSQAIMISLNILQHETQ